MRWQNGRTLKHASSSATLRRVSHSELQALPAVVKKRPKYSVWVSAAALVITLGLIGRGLARNPHIDWSVVGDFMLDGRVIDGLLATLLLGCLSFVLSFVVGLFVGLARLSKNPVVRFAASIWVWIFVSVPALIQILFWGNFSLFVERISIGIPGTSIAFFSTDTNEVLTTFTAALVALTLNNSAYMAEIIRGSIISIEQGQLDASDALALSWWRTQRHVILPQAARVMAPPSGSRFVSMLKETTLVSVIAGGDLLTETQNISAANFKVIELLFVAAIWFLLVTSVSDVGQRLIEKRLNRSHRVAVD